MPRRKAGFFAFVSMPIYPGISRRECGDIVCFGNAGIDTLTNDFDNDFHYQLRRNNAGITFPLTPTPIQVSRPNNAGIEEL